MLSKILISICYAIGTILILFGMLFAAASEGDSFMMTFGIIIALLGITIIVCTKINQSKKGIEFKTSKNETPTSVKGVSDIIKKEAKKNNKKFQQESLLKQGILIQAELPHISGLNNVENLPCLINVMTDSYKFEVSNINFSLPRNKITDICIKTKTEIEKQYVSSIGGAAMGAALFGMAGAAYGGRAKAKQISNTTKFLVFTYIGEEAADIKNIIFGIDSGLTDEQIRAKRWSGTKSDFVVAQKIVDEFNNNTIKSVAVNIEL